MNMSDEQRLQLQIALLHYLVFAKPIRGAATHKEFDIYGRKDIRVMKDALLLLGFLQTIPGMKTAGQLYRTTKAGRQRLQQLTKKNPNYEMA